jgi:hypothetical protein
MNGVNGHRIFAILLYSSRISSTPINCHEQNSQFTSNAYRHTDQFLVCMLLPMELHARQGHIMMATQSHGQWLLRVQPQGQHWGRRQHFFPYTATARKGQKQTGHLPHRRGCHTQPNLRRMQPTLYSIQHLFRTSMSPKELRLTWIWPKGQSALWYKRHSSLWK